MSNSFANTKNSNSTLQAVIMLFYMTLTKGASFGTFTAIHFKMLQHCFQG